MRIIRRYIILCGIGLFAAHGSVASAVGGRSYTNGQKLVAMVMAAAALDALLCKDNAEVSKLLANAKRFIQWIKSPSKNGYLIDATAYLGSHKTGALAALVGAILLAYNRKRIAQWADVRAIGLKGFTHQVQPLSIASNGGNGFHHRPESPLSAHIDGREVDFTPKAAVEVDGNSPRELARALVTEVSKREGTSFVQKYSVKQVQDLVGFLTQESDRIDKSSRLLCLAEIMGAFAICAPTLVPMYFSRKELTLLIEGMVDPDKRVQERCVMSVGAFIFSLRGGEFRSFFSAEILGLLKAKFDFQRNPNLVFTLRSLVFQLSPEERCEFLTKEVIGQLGNGLHAEQSDVRRECADILATIALDFRGKVGASAPIPQEVCDQAIAVLEKVAETLDQKYDPFDSAAVVASLLKLGVRYSAIRPELRRSTP